MSETTRPAETGALSVDVQVALELADGDSTEDEPPSEAQLAEWAALAYQTVRQVPAEVTLRLCEEAESHSLNLAYRGMDKSTNVLSFPFDGGSDEMAIAMADLEIPILGDIVICHQVLIDEARQQQKTLSEHYAHMVTHGILHLCGFDHEDEATAHEMESLEITILAASNIANPYH